MAWIVEKLILICVEGIMLMLAMLASNMSTLFGLNGVDTLDYFFSVFGEAPKSMYRMFMVIAFGLIFLAMIYQIFKAFFGPLTEAEPPTRVIIRTAFFSLLVAYAQYIVAFVFEIATIPYKAIQGTGWDFASTLIKNWATDALNLDTMAGAGLEFITETALGGVGWINALLIIVLYTMLLKQFIQLMLEIVERYVVIALLTIVAPLCIACGAIKGVSEVFKNWLSFLINGCIVLIFSTFFVSVFFASFVPTGDFMQIMIYICWIKTGMKVDEHMNALGLKTAKTGGFGADLMTAMHATAPKVAPMLNKAMGMNIGGGKGWRDSLGLADRANGKDKASTKSLMGGLLRTKKGSSMADAADNKARKIGGTLNNSALAKGLGMGGERGKNTNMSYDQMNAWKMGKANDVSASLKPAFNQDMAQKELGSKFMDDMKEKGMKLDDVSKDKDGNAVFKFSDDKGNNMAVKAVDNPDPENNMSKITGDDGKERGLMVAASSDPANPADLSAVGAQPVDADAAAQSMANMDDNAVNISSLSNDAPDAANGEVSMEGMEQGAADMSQTYNMDENGNMVEAEDGNGSHVAIKDDNGNVMGYATTEDAQSQAAENGVAFADGSVGKVDTEGPRYSMDENGNAVEDANGDRMAVQMSDGSTQYKTQDEVDSASPMVNTGAAAYNMAGVEASVNGAETYNMSADGKMEAASDGTGQYVKGNINGQEAYLDKNQLASDVDGSTSYRMGSDGKMEAVSDGTGDYVKGNVGGNETYLNKAQVAGGVDTSTSYSMGSDGKMQESKGNDGDYYKGNINGQETYINKNQMDSASATVGSGAFANTFSNVNGAMVQTSGGAYNMTGNGQFMTSDQIASQQQQGRIVESASGGYIATTDSIRRDATGQPSPDGEYMRSVRENGNPVLERVKTDSNNDVVTAVPRSNYSYNSSYTPESVSNSVAPTNDISGATGVFRSGEFHAFAPNEVVKTGDNSSALQQYIRPSNGGPDIAVDMEKASFNSNGQVVPVNNQIPVKTTNANGETVSTTMPVSDIYAGDKTKDNEYRTYFHAMSSDNKEVNSFEYNQGSVKYGKPCNSYVNDVPTSFNPSDYRVYDSPVNDSNYSVGQKIAVNQNNGQAIALTPMDNSGYNFSEAVGTSVEIGGRKYFAESLNAPAMGDAVSTLGFKASTPGSYQITGSNFEALRAMCGKENIPSNATDVKVDIAPSGFMAISFKHDNQNVVISNAGNGERVYAPSVSKNGEKAVAGKNVTLGFKQVSKDSITVNNTKGYNKKLSKAKNKGFSFRKKRN